MLRRGEPQRSYKKQYCDRYTDEIERVRKFYTGNDQSHCWHTSTPQVVNFTGSDEKICVINSKCINIHSIDNKINDGEWLACAFDNETESCPSSTQCLRDPSVRIKSWFYPQYPLSQMEQMKNPTRATRTPYKTTSKSKLNQAGPLLNLLKQVQ